MAIFRKKYFSQWLKYVPYIGIIVVSFMFVEARRNVNDASETLTKSIKRQEKLRNLMWANLLVQRAAGFAMMGKITGDRSYIERAQAIADSIQAYIAGADIPGLIELQNDLGGREIGVLHDKVEHIGQSLNRIEVKEWFTLHDNNERLLAEIKNGHEKLLRIFIIFIAFLVLLVWVMRKMKAADTLRFERDAAEDANRSKSLFLANVSYELRTPMHGILSFARFGQQKFEIATKEKLKSYFDEIYESGARLMSLLNDLLDLSKLEAGKVVYSMQEWDLVAVIETVAAEMGAFALEKKIKIEVDKSSPEISVIFDSEKIMQVVRNLLSNAIKFSASDSTVEIHFRETDETVRFSVVNQGVGIPKDELERVFDKFVQSSKTRTGAGGTGLGLAICREIVSQHQGKIWAQSGQGGMTEFIVELPRSLKNAVRKSA